MHTSTLLLILLTAGLTSQWVASRLRLPAIVILIASGLILGPGTGIISLDLPKGELTELIGLGVAIILFEGGMDLKFGEFRRLGAGIGRLTILAPPLAWLLGALAAHFVAGLSWAVSWVLGAILVVTGPTVILPLMRQARLNKETMSLLKWEGIVNDPVGVLLAVLTFQYFTLVDGGFSHAVSGLAGAVLAAGLLGGCGGWLTAWCFRKGWVPPHLKPPMLMVIVLGMYWLSNLVQHEAGLLTVTAMGLVIGNMELVERESLRHFKENLTVILLSVLFIVIPSQITIDQIQQLTWRSAGFVLVVLIVVRPVAIGLATLGSPIRKKDRLLLSWIAPRGIVAAATAGIFGPEMALAGYEGAELLLPVVFLVILVTVLLHGLTLAPLAKRLELAAARRNGLMIVGASPFTQMLAKKLKSLNVDVLISDGGYERLKTVRMEGIPVYYGEILSEHAESGLETEHLSYVLCATDNDYYNALVCKVQGRKFGYHRTFQLPTHQESKKEKKRLTLQQRGYFAFHPKANYEQLLSWMQSGWTLQTTKISKDYRLNQLENQMGARGENWIELGYISPSGLFHLYCPEQKRAPEPGWTLIYFAECSDDESDGLPDLDG